MSKLKGFTLVELLVVISIVGLLSSVVFASLTSARGKARIANAQQAMSNVKALALSCLTSIPATALNIAGTEASSGWTGAVCTGSGNYPVLPGDWKYCDNDGGSGCSTPSTSSTGAGTFTIASQSVTDGKKITCTEAGCVTN